MEEEPPSRLSACSTSVPACRRRRHLTAPLALQVVIHGQPRRNDVFGNDNGIDLQLDVTSVTLSYIKMTEMNSWALPMASVSRCRS
ncbi:hypothetical protein V6L77_01375 [Pannonibacter sp. Pt2-lr]